MPEPNVQLSDEEFRSLANLIYQQAGIRLKDNKKQLLRSRLKNRLRELELESFDEYFRIIRQDDSGRELNVLLDAISTNVTSFYRESAHFDFMSSTVIPELLENYNSNEKHTYIHLWSAACSTGQEPYTMAINLHENIPNPQGYNIKILATDLADKVLEEAARGVYDEGDVEDVNPMVVNRHFDKFEQNGESKVRVKDHIRNLIRFGKLNLNRKEYPFTKRFDVIFCRNVMIYFDSDVMQQVVNQFEDNLKSGGYLFVGHSESLAGINHGLDYVEPTIYQKP